jgi:hypothetical protein
MPPGNRKRVWGYCLFAGSIILFLATPFIPIFTFGLCFALGFGFAVVGGMAVGMVLMDSKSATRS